VVGRKGAAERQHAFLESIEKQLRVSSQPAAGSCVLPLDALEHRLEAPNIFPDQDDDQALLGGEVIVHAGFRDRRVLGQIGVAETGIAAAAGEKFGFLENDASNVPAHENLSPYPGLVRRRIGALRFFQARGEIPGHRDMGAGALGTMVEDLPTCAGGKEKGIAGVEPVPTAFRLDADMELALLDIQRRVAREGEGLGALAADQIEQRALQREVGITFIFVTHDQEEALTLSDRIAIMSAGRVLQCDAPRRLYERPQSREVAAFLGDMNFFEGLVEHLGPAGVVVEVAGFGPLTFADIAADAGLDLGPGRKIAVALRPERLSLAPAAANRARGRVRDKSYFGNRTNYLIGMAGLAKPVVVSCANDAIHAGDAAEIGEERSLTLDLTGAILLPAT
jgi:hypothetical protein